MLLCLIHRLLGGVTKVGPVRGTVVVVALGKDKDVVTTAEGILENGSRAEVDVRVGTRCLVGRGAIEVPNAELVDARDLLGHSLLKRSGGISMRSVGAPRVQFFVRSGWWARHCTPCATTRGGYTHRRLRTKAAVSVNPDICNATRLY